MILFRAIPANRTSNFSWVSYVLPTYACPSYLASKWSFSQFELPSWGLNNICAFDRFNRVIGKRKIIF
jgi:hypothetical protein